ncbi:MAG: 50S ribosomal protein L11 methyltransferase [Gammaproteobacteria bacterium]|nr:50S ribosomal protein L11 methyltransferase [Gammaproteobacteria bacterium]
MAWIQIHLTTDRPSVPLAELLLESLGALSITMEDAADEPMLEPTLGTTPLWHQTRVTGLFPEHSNPEQLSRDIHNGLPPTSPFELEVERLADQVWERVWMDDFHPMCFGHRLWIAPEGQPPEDPEAITVQLDPGLAFGTGTHPTTALCLNWLDRTDIAGASIIDFGCGSGILSVAALLLGANRVTAIDHDPQALQATADNALKNRVRDNLIILDNNQPLSTSADITMANILASTLIELEPLLASHTKSGGQIILSGILEEQSDVVISAFTDNFQIESPTTQEGWVLLHGMRR